MATVVDPEYRARLKALADKFAATVPVTMEKIRVATAACAAGVGSDPARPQQPDEASLQALHELLHGVAGSAGTFGFGTLGQQCRRIEQMMRALMAGQGDWADVAADLVVLQGWAARDPAAVLYE